ncbi:hypothetical protein [Musicola paradisiaca]|uniref:Uncharacterized protein n=1 Tax=Musicola paradisiaca (strain Ech703) TaxID=579405 RepID=C6C384_MUSP7|nr:hypothetical protein [Musicola paradisiaca]ACS87182.1 conserved hypothetical protein [Musicola paradisiaca Ech703]
MSELHTVADYLAKQATSVHSKGGPSLLLAGAFGRTAYNRYYYACYLDIRMFVAEINSKWGSLNHSEVPDFLIGAVNNRISQELTKCERGGMITKGELLSKKSLVHTSLNNMASVMSKAYTIRCTVDYEPDVNIEFDKNTFLIDQVPVASAKDWLKTITIEKVKVIKVMKEIGLVQ